MTQKSMALILSAAIIGGCAKQMLPGDDIVQIVDERAAVARCMSLGQVKAGSAFSDVTSRRGYDNLITELKNATAELGGTHLLLLDLRDNFSSAAIIGDAYRCVTR